MSLRTLGELTGLTASFISQLENDLTEPSINSLQKIAVALKAPIFTFLNGSKYPEHVVRRDARKRLSFPNPHLQYELLTDDLTRQMAGFLIHLKTGESHTTQKLYKATEELMYVLQGELEILLAENTYRLQPGDSIYYEGASLSGFSSIGDEDMIALCVITPPAF